MKLIILEVIAPQGKAPTKLNLKDIDTEKNYSNVAVWPTDWPAARWNQDEEVEGNIEEKEKEYNGKMYKNFTLKPLNAVPRSYSGGNKAAINAAMEKKNESIGKFQESKEASIMISSTFRDATILTQLELQNPNGSPTEELIKERWKVWRAWLLDQYGKDQRVEDSEEMLKNSPF